MQIVSKKPKKKGILTSEFVTASGVVFFLTHEAAQKWRKPKKTPTAPEGA